MRLKAKTKASEGCVRSAGFRGSCFLILQERYTKYIALVKKKTKDICEACGFCL